LIFVNLIREDTVRMDKKDPARSGAGSASSSDA
jgi:hypothetical protein